MSTSATDDAAVGSISAWVPDEDLALANAIRYYGFGARQG
jgi:hypothetical protein